MGKLRKARVGVLHSSLYRAPVSTEWGPPSQSRPRRPDPCLAPPSWPEPGTRWVWGDSGAPPSPGGPRSPTGVLALSYPRLAFAANQDLNSGLGACTKSPPQPDLSRCLIVARCTRLGWPESSLHPFVRHNPPPLRRLTGEAVASQIGKLRLEGKSDLVTGVGRLGPRRRPRGAVPGRGPFKPLPHAAGASLCNWAVVLA